MSFDEFYDLGFQVFDGSMDAAFQLLAGEFGEPAPDLLGFTSGVVVHDDMDIEVVGDAGVDSLQERQEFLGPVALVVLADDEARGGSDPKTNAARDAGAPAAPNKPALARSKTQEV